MKNWCVYFLSNGVNVKIGCSGDVVERKRGVEYMAGIRGGGYGALRCILLVDGLGRAQAYSLESELHRQLDRYSLGGEWFRLGFNPEAEVGKAQAEIAFDYIDHSLEHEESTEFEDEVGWNQKGVDTKILFG